MSFLDVETISGIHIIRMSDICGLWEVVRISQKDSHQTIYPWVKDRFKFNFLPEMLFICFQDGKKSQGTWELSEKIYESQKRYSIILNETFEYSILDISEDDIILSDHINKYLLVRRL
jgi:hypothetical protein